VGEPRVKDYSMMVPLGGENDSDSFPLAV